MASHDLVVEPNVGGGPPRGGRSRSRWGSVIAFQTGMLIVLAVPRSPEREYLPFVVALPRGTPAPAAPDPPPTAASTPAPARRLARNRAPTAPPAVAEDALVEVTIASDPPGARVRIGDAIGGITPLAAFLPTDHPTALRLELDGYAAYETTWSRASRRRVYAALRPAR